MTKTIIIPDIHHKTAKADAILAHESYDKVIFTGDYFDDFNDVPEDARRTALWLKDSLDKPNRIHLLGNHDYAYAYPFNQHAECSGFSRSKDHAIWEVLNRDDFNKLALYHIQDGILFSHAGLSAKLLKRATGGTFKTLDEVSKWLESEIPKVREASDINISHYLYAAGWSRGGREPIGGLTWADFDIDMLATEFPQIVGHTPHPKPDFHLRTPNASRIQKREASEAEQNDLSHYWWTLDLDTHLNHYAIIDNGILIIKEVSWSGLGNKNVNHSFEIFEGKI